MYNDAGASMSLGNAAACMKALELAGAPESFTAAFKAMAAAAAGAAAAGDATHAAAVVPATQRPAKRKAAASQLSHPQAHDVDAAAEAMAADVAVEALLGLADVGRPVKVAQTLLQHPAMPAADCSSAGDPNNYTFESNTSSTLVRTAQH